MIEAMTKMMEPIMAMMRYTSCLFSASSLFFRLSASVSSPEARRFAASAVCDGKMVSMNFSIYFKQLAKLTLFNEGKRQV